MTASTAQRKHMLLGQVYTNEITDQRILQAMAEIPREPFVPEVLRGAAYADNDLAIGSGRFLLAPLTFARLLDMANITPACRVLNVGCTTGYSTAIISKLAHQVVGIDTDATMLTQARATLDLFNIRNAQTQQVQSLAAGLPSGSPYNVIVVQGAIDFIPDALATQLAEGGRLVTIRRTSTPPAIPSVYGNGLLVCRLDNSLQYRESFEMAAPLLTDFQQKNSFAF